MTFVQQLKSQSNFVGYNRPFRSNHEWVQDQSLTTTPEYQGFLKRRREESECKKKSGDYRSFSPIRIVNDHTTLKNNRRKIKNHHVYYHYVKVPSFLFVINNGRVVHSSGHSSLNICNKTS